MKSHKQLLIGLLAGLITLLSGLYLGNEIYMLEQNDVIPANAVKLFMATSLKDAKGKTHSLSRWDGIIRVINFWASWCPPCREEMPALSRLQTKYAHNNVKFLGISIDSADNVRTYSRDNPVNYPLLVAYSEGSELSQLLGNSSLALPYTVVIDSHNAVFFSQLGPISEQDLDNLLQKLTNR